MDSMNRPKQGGPGIGFSHFSGMMTVIVLLCHPTTSRQGVKTRSRVPRNTERRTAERRTVSVFPERLYHIPSEDDWRQFYVALEAPKEVLGSLHVS